MNFYVPTIGDSIYLLEPWTFTLYQERRNQGLAKRMEQCGETQTLYNYRRKIYIKQPFSTGDSFWVRRSYPVGEQEWYLNEPNTTFEQDLTSRSLLKFKDCIEDRGVISIPYKRFTWSDSRAEVTLPARTELKVDRIYIKSTYRDFDSITFRIGQCPENNKLSKARFWVKLKDANKIVCDLYPVADTEALKLFQQTNRFARLQEE